MTTPTASDVRQTAEALFSSGFYCAESVVLAVARAQGIESELIPKAATAFCSGMARSGGHCGALTGALMGIGLALGRSEAAGSVEQTYAATQRLIRQFECEFGARDCHALLGCDLGRPEGQAVFRENNLGLRCRNFTGRAAEMAAGILLEANSRPAAEKLPTQDS